VVSYGYEEDVIFELEYEKDMRQLTLGLHFFPSAPGGNTLLNEIRVDVCYTFDKTCVSFDIDGYYEEHSWDPAMAGIIVFANAAHVLFIGECQQVRGSKD